MNKQRSEVERFNDFIILDTKELGSGYISIVKKAKHKITGKPYAVKIVS